MDICIAEGFSQLKVTAGETKSAEDGEAFEPTGHYEMSNGYFTVKCTYSGDAEAVVCQRKEGWAGVCLSPLLPGEEAISEERTHKMSRQLVMPDEQEKKD